MSTGTGDLRELTVGTGAGLVPDRGDDPQLGADMVLNIGPQHPSTHGVLRLRLVLDGERVVSCEPVVGYMHRGAEKLFEVRDYRQIIVLANRHDWLSAFANELGVVLGVEHLLGMEVPERAVWARTLLAELNRVLNHLMFLGSYPLELGAITPILAILLSAAPPPPPVPVCVRVPHALTVNAAATRDAPVMINLRRSTSVLP